MADYNVTVNTADVFRSTVISKEALVAREHNLVLANLVKRYDRDTHGGVKSITVGLISNLTAVQKSPDTALSFAAPTETDLHINLDQIWAVPIRIEEMAEIQSVIELASAYAEKSGYAIAAKIDSFIDAALVSGLSANTVGTYAQALSYDTIRSAKLKLDEADVPTERVFVTGAKGMDDMLNIDEFTQYQLNANPANNNPFNTGKVGYVLGMDVFMSTNLHSVAGTPVENHAFMFNKEVYALAIQKDVSSKKQYFLEHLAEGMVTWAIWGGAMLRADHGVLVKC
jgi:N4-gp56 family major capsid protein